MKMRKQLLSAILASAMVCGVLAPTAVQAEDYDLTLYSIDTTKANFDTWLAAAEKGTGLKIQVIAAPTDSDTRQQKSQRCFPPEIHPWMYFRSMMRWQRHLKIQDGWKD